MKYVCPLVTVKDINKSRDFYENVLNQQIKYDFGENIIFHGDFSIHLQSHYEKLIENKKIVSGGNNFELYFEEDQIEQTVKTLKGHKVRFVHELREQPWRQKVVRFYDPDDNIIEIGESLEYLSYRLKKEGLEVSQIAEILTMPLDFVIKSIDEKENR